MRWWECDGSNFGSPVTCASLMLGLRPVGSVFCSGCVFNTALCQSATGSGGYPSLGKGGAPRGAAGSAGAVNGFGGAAGGGSGSGGTASAGNPAVCTPGQQVRCACPGQADGIQVCASTGLKFDARECASPGNGGGSSEAGTPAAKSVTTSGCGCQVGASGSQGSSVAWLSLALVVARRRRRDRKR